MNDKLLIGALETCDLPDIGISGLEIRVDTGAQTSSLHVDNIQEYDHKGETWIGFDLHPDVHQVERIVRCQTPLKAVRRIKSSNGETQQRYVIETSIVLGGKTWPLEITLSDRSDMSYLMLLGREGMGDRVLVDPSQDFLLSRSNG